MPVIDPDAESTIIITVNSKVETSKVAGTEYWIHGLASMFGGEAAQVAIHIPEDLWQRLDMLDTLEFVLVNVLRNGENIL